MPRKTDPEQRALALLRRQAREGVPGSASQLALAERRAKRDAEKKAKRDAELEAQEARTRSRAVEIIGPDFPPWYGPAMLAWLADPDPDAPCPQRVDAEFLRLYAEGVRYEAAGSPDDWTPAWPDEYAAGRFIDQDGVTVDLNDPESVAAATLRHERRSTT